MHRRLGVDVGGTFTDSVLWEDGKFVIAKSPTTTPQSTAVIDNVARLGLVSTTDLLLHGTTVATNAVLERKGGPAGLITTKGFGDLLLIQRGDRSGLYDSRYQKPRPVVERDLTVEVTERVDAGGRVVQALLEEDVVSAVDYLRERGVKSIAVSLLFSYLNPAHEQRIRDIIRSLAPEMFVSLSSDVAPEWKEFERTNTTALNAYCMPAVASYLVGLREQLQDRGYGQDYFVMQSSGGVVTSDRAARFPCTTLVSGPAAGVQAAASIASEMGLYDLLSLDMGGTSADVCLIEGGRPTTTPESTVNGLPLKVQSIALEAIGAGGGSVARVDAGGRLQVGPQSAGSNPGPACYGRGGVEPTVTDAAVVAGLVSADLKIGGEIQIDEAAAYKAIGRVAEPLGLDHRSAALGIMDLAIDHMAHACRAASIAQGRDPRRLGLFAFGGAGPMFGCRLAQELGIDKVVIPAHPGVTSAIGLLSCPLRYDFVRTRIRLASEMGPEDLSEIYERLEAEARQVLQEENPDFNALTTTRSLDARYVGQTHDVEVPVSSGDITDAIHDEISDRFNEMHRAKFGFALENRDLELVAFRVSAIVELPAPDFTPSESTDESDQLQLVERRPVSFGGGELETPIFVRSGYGKGIEIQGPAIINQLDATIVIPPGFAASSDVHGHLTVTAAE